MVLTLAAFASAYAALFAALVFTFLVPGLIACRFFRLKSHEVWAFVPVFSVLVSVQLVYYLSLVFGYSRETVVLSFLVLTAVYTLVVFWKGERLRPAGFLKLKYVKKTSLLLFSVIFLVSAVVLFRSVWLQNQSGIVITGSSWQDTPAHYEYVESMNNGNFPPQMPNFSGQRLTYHYFVDFHTAVVEKVFGYLPELLPFLNVVFIVVFGLGVYAVARVHGRRAAVVAVVIGIFGWGLSYFGLFSALLNGQFSAGQNYIYHYGETFGLPSIFDNLLQQRPMLVGLPVFCLILALLRDMGDRRRLLLAGLVTGLVFQFHNVAFFTGYVAFAVAVLLNLKRFRFSWLLFVLPTFLALPFIFSGGLPISVSVSSLWIVDFAENPLVYYFLNLGVPLVVALVSFVKRGNWVLKGTFLLLMLIPNVVLLTPNVWDMYKFFIFAWVPIAVLCGFVLAKARRVVVFAVVLLSVLTSASVIVFNVGTSFQAASWSEYDAGLWVRQNTPERSVFLTYYSIYSPPTFIGGRLRVASYVNWAYGYGIPLDSIYKRTADVDRAFNGSATDLLDVVRLYNVSYVYVGSDELASYPDCTARFDAVDWLMPVYENEGLKIYWVNLP